MKSSIDDMNALEVEADAALAAGDYRLAAQLYGRIINKFYNFSRLEKFARKQTEAMKKLFAEEDSKK